jgi:twitching motility protein PilT
MVRFAEWAEAALERQPEATDLFLVPRRRPAVRVRGRLIFLDDLPTVGEDVTIRFAATRGLQVGVGSESPPADSLDFSLQAAGRRWRVNLFRCGRSWRLAARRLGDRPRPLEELGFERTDIFLHRQGLVVVAGPAGSGKTTTMSSAAAFLLERNAWHLISAEDPVEYVIPDGKGLVSQREVGRDCPDFDTALRDALRESPDVIVLGEMRDAAAASTALRAAETGHLVMTTVHAHSLEDAVGRIVHMSPDPKRARVQLASTLRLLLVQRLVSLRDGRTVLLYEGVLGRTDALAAVREHAEHTLKNVCLVHGFRPIAEQLERMAARGLVDREEARRFE